MSLTTWIVAAETGDWTGRSDNVGLAETKVLDQFQLPVGYWFDQMVDWLDLNVSTVSRAVAGKHAQTPWGIFPLRYFFQGAGGGSEERWLLEGGKPGHVQHPVSVL